MTLSLLPPPTLLQPPPVNSATPSTTTSNPAKPAGLLPTESAQLLQESNLLHLLHVRNLNQHRRSPWYLHFNRLRREIRGLCKDLAVYDEQSGCTVRGTVANGEDGVSRAERSKELQRLRARDGEDAGLSEKKARRRRRRKSKRKEKAVRNTGVASVASAVSRRKVDTERARELAGRRLTRWKEGGLIVRCFVAFSRHLLTPSVGPQFITLGLALLGILARIARLTGLTADYERTAAMIENEEDRKELMDMRRKLRSDRVERRERADGPLESVAQSMDVDSGVEDSNVAVAEDIGEVVARD
ncbi:MAG: hypothetical protein M1831_002892 [Alyxoria varia]|nr:MAG: hypothetical protein M1831_002892 [Alyxoria varia]